MKDDRPSMQLRYWLYRRADSYFACAAFATHSEARVYMLKEQLAKMYDAYSEEWIIK